MKKIILILTLSFFVLTLKAQTINGVKLSDIKSHYIEILCKGKIFSTKVTVDVDYGQPTKRDAFGERMKMNFKDENGKPITFNSSIDALNFFEKNGYKFVTAYTITHGNQNIYHYLMERKDDNKSEHP